MKIAESARLTIDKNVNPVNDIVEATEIFILRSVVIRKKIEIRNEGAN